MIKNVLKITKPVIVGLVKTKCSKDKFVETKLYEWLKNSTTMEREHFPATISRVKGQGRSGCLILAWDTRYFKKLKCFTDDRRYILVDGELIFEKSITPIPLSFLLIYGSSIVEERNY